MPIPSPTPPLSEPLLFPTHSDGDGPGPQCTRQFADHYIAIDRRSSADANSWRNRNTFLVLPWRLALWLLSIGVLILCFVCGMLERLITKHPLRESYSGILGYRLFLLLNMLRIHTEYVDVEEQFENLRDSAIVVAK